jgi:hypothetical protein
MYPACQFFSCCHDEIRASSSYHFFGVLRLWNSQSFRKPVRPFAHQALIIRQAGKNVLCSSTLLNLRVYAVVG